MGIHKAPLVEQQGEEIIDASRGDFDKGLDHPQRVHCVGSRLLWPDLSFDDNKHILMISMIFY